MADRRFDSSDQEDDSFAAPSTPPQGRSKTPTQQQQPSRFDTAEAREAALRKELDGVRKINEVIEGVLGTLERAKGNMGVCGFLPLDITCHDMRHACANPPPLYRLYPRQSTTPRHCSTRGRASSRRPSTTNGSSSTRTGRARHRTWSIWRARRCRSSRRPSGGRRKQSGGARRQRGRLRMRRGGERQGQRRRQLGGLGGVLRGGG